MNDLPPPLTPPDADLRFVPDMMLNVLRLRDSRLAQVENAEVFRAAVLSWCVAWHQVPAGSLPNDDRELAVLLRYGTRTDIRRWKALRKAGALRGWIECSDGRLYHPVVAEVVHRTLARIKRRRGVESPLKSPPDSPPESPPESGGESGDLVGDKPLKTLDCSTGVEKSRDKIYKDTRRTRPPSGDVSVPDLGGDPDAVLWDMLAVWNAMAGENNLPSVRDLSRERRIALRARIHERWSRDPVGKFRAYCARIASSPFLTGRVPGAKWKANFDWAIKPTSVLRVIEGAYHDGEPWDER